MKGLFSRLAFTGFGPCELPGMVASAPTAVHGSRPGRLREKIRKFGPRRPGVYGMVDAAGELIYVGKAKCLRTRLLSYFRPKSRDPKAGRILEAARLITWEPASSEFAALLRELELIRRWQPRFNVQGQPSRRRRVYVCVGRKPAPHVFLAARPPRTARWLFGPVPAGATARAAARRLNDWFGLRDCPQAQEMLFSDQQELFPVVRAPGCIRHEIGQCLAPCAAGCSRAEYVRHVRAALGFLGGADASPLETLERAMHAASEGMAFERAAVLRDRLAALRWLWGHLERVREAARQSFVYAVAGHEGGELWYLIHGGRVRAVVPAPADDAARRRAAPLLEASFAGDGRANGNLSLDEIDAVLLVASWFRRHPAERQRTLAARAALDLTRTPRR